jgi:hypothetical protein
MFLFIPELWAFENQTTISNAFSQVSAVPAHP